MLKRMLLSALLLAVPACASTNTGETAPPPPGKVMIIGDSISLGLGDMDPGTDCPVTPEFSSREHSYGVQVARALDVDYILYAWPGAGLVRNFGKDQTQTISIRMNRLEEAHMLDGIGPLQLILVNVGTHDFHQADPTDTFVPAMEDLLTMLETRFPEATIYALTGPMLAGTENAFHDQAVRTAVDEVNAETGADIRYLALNGGDERMAHGCAWHPSVPAHDHMSAMILEDLKAHE